MTNMNTLEPVGRVAWAPTEPPAAHGLDVQVVGDRNDLIVRLRGDAGFMEADKLEAALLPICAQRPARVTFDLSELRFISSLGLRALVCYRWGAVRAGVRVCLAADLQPAVLDTLQTTGLLELFEVVTCPFSSLL